MRNIGTLDAIAAWGLIILGCVHNFVAAPMTYPALSERLFWFLGTGLALWYAGALNLVRRSSPNSRSTAVTCLLANVTLLAFVLGFGIFTGSIRRPEGIFLVAIVATATLFSVRSLRTPAPSQPRHRRA